MPALPDVPGVLKVIFGVTLGEDVNAINRLHVSYTGTAPTDAVCVALATELYNIYAAEFCVYMRSSDSLDYCEVTDLTSPTSGQGLYTHSTSGSLAGAILAANVAFVASLRIARRYRGGKPRTYLMVLDPSYMQDAQTWTDVAVGDIQASLDAFRADVLGFTSSGTVLQQLVNVSYYEGFVNATNPITGRVRAIPKLRAGGPQVDPATGWVAEKRIGSQRRRSLRSS